MDRAAPQLLLCIGLLLFVMAGSTAGAAAESNLFDHDVTDLSELSPDDTSTAATGEVELELRPANATVGPGENATYDIVVVDPDSGIGAYSFNVTVGTTSVAEIDGFDLDRAAFDDSFVTADNGTVVFDVALGQDVYEPAAEVTVASINLTAVGDAGESTTAGFAYEPDVAVSDANDTSYTVTDDRSATFGIANQSAFVVGNLTPSAATVIEGETVNVSADVENVGSAGTQTVTLTAGGYSNSTEVALSEGANETVSFPLNTSALGPGEYEHVVATENDTASGTLTVLESAAFAVTIQGATTPAEGENLNVTVAVENVGGSEETQTIALDVGALGSASTNVTLAGGNATQVNFSVGTGQGDAGEYTATATSADDSDATNVTVLSPAGEVGLELAPDSPVVEPGGNATLDIVVTGANEGISAYSFNVSVGDTSVATIEEFDLNRVAFDNSFITSDGKTLALAVALGDDTYGPGQEITVATVDVATAGSANESTPVAFAYDAGDAVEGANGEAYTVTGDQPATFSIADSPVFEVRDLRPAAASVVEGEVVNVSADIENVGSTATQTVTLTVGEYSNSTTVALSGGDNETVSFPVNTSALGTGEYEHVVATDNDTANGTLTVLESAAFTVTILETNTPVEGDDLDVTVAVENVGGSEETQTIALDVGALGSASTNVTLTGGNATQVNFTIGTSPGDLGEYTATVTSADDSDSTNVTVLSPADQVGLELRPADGLLPPDGNTTFDIVVTGANEGISVYSFNVTVADTAVAAIEDFDLDRSTFDDSFITSDGKTLVLAVALGGDTYDPAQEITVATVDVAATGNTNESTAVAFTYEAEGAVEGIGGANYTVGSDQPATLAVGLPPLPAFENPPRDPDGDGDYENVDGDGLFDIFDVQAFFTYLKSDPVQNNAWAYDFDSSGKVDIFDVQALFDAVPSG